MGAELKLSEESKDFRCAILDHHDLQLGLCLIKEMPCLSEKNDRYNPTNTEPFLYYIEPMIIRLRGGRASSEGRVEAAKGRKFGSICDTHWTLNEANVVCRQLNFARFGIYRPMLGIPHTTQSYATL